MNVEIKRRRDWRPRLDGYINARRARGFEWGVFDCAVFAAGAVYAQTGANLIARLGVGRYDSRLGAGRELLRLGCKDVAAAFDLVLPAIAPARAHIGDLAAFSTETDGPAFGVVGGAHVFIVTPAGLGLRDLRGAARAWAV